MRLRFVCNNNIFNIFLVILYKDFFLSFERHSYREKQLRGVPYVASLQYCLRGWDWARPKPASHAGDRQASTRPCTFICTLAGGWVRSAVLMTRTGTPVGCLHHGLWFRPLCHNVNILGNISVTFNSGRKCANLINSFSQDGKKQLKS